MEVRRTQWAPAELAKQALRRPKSVLGAELPPKTLIVQKVILDRRHRKAYDALFNSARKDIADILDLSPGTVRNYLSEAAQKLGAANRVEAGRIARSNGWL